MKQAIALIGPGRLGAALGRSLYSCGYPLNAVVGRTRDSALEACDFIGCPRSLATTAIETALGARIILLTVPDTRIALLSRSLQDLDEWSPGTLLIHCSGFFAADIMRHPVAKAELLSLHPLLPFADRSIALKKLPGCPCALEGDSAALATGEALIGAWGGRAFRIDGKAKATYHTAAAIASNFLVTLLGEARDLLEEKNIGGIRAVELFMPLLRATLDNVEHLGPEQALTGPIVRGDVPTVRAHLEVLQDCNNPRGLELYQLLGERTVALAQHAGRLSQDAAEHLIETLTRAPLFSQPGNHENQKSEKNN